MSAAETQAPLSPVDEWHAIALAGLQFAPMAMGTVSELVGMLRQVRGLEDDELRALQKRAESLDKLVRDRYEALAALPAAYMTRLVLADAMGRGA